MAREITEIKINEHGDETHESWILVRAGRVSANPHHHLFDSDIAHQHYIQVTISRCFRKRDLNRDWKFEGKTLMVFDLSEAQWGAFISSFGHGSGVPATLSYLGTLDAPSPQIPQAPFASRLNESHNEVKEAGNKAIAEIQKHYQEMLEAFEAGAGKKVMREKIKGLGSSINNTAPNLKFAAESLTEHVEKVVTKARADIEAMMTQAFEQGHLDTGSILEITTGDTCTDEV